MTNSELMYFPSTTIAMEEPILTTTTITTNDTTYDINTTYGAIVKAIQNARKNSSNKNQKDEIYPEIVKIEILVPNKVLRFTFKYGTQIKTICNDEDVFDFDFAIYLAYSKLINSNKFTKEGIEHMAHEMTYQKKWVKKVKEAKKLFKQQETERIKQEKEEKERAAARKRQAEKKARKKKERKERELKALAEKIKNVN